MSWQGQITNNKWASYRGVVSVFKRRTKYQELLQRQKVIQKKVLGGSVSSNTLRFIKKCRGRDRSPITNGPAMGCRVCVQEKHEVPESFCKDKRLYKKTVLGGSVSSSTLRFIKKCRGRDRSPITNGPAIGVSCLCSRETESTRELLQRQKVIE